MKKFFVYPKYAIPLLLVITSLLGPLNGFAQGGTIQTKDGASYPVIIIMKHLILLGLALLCLCGSITAQTNTYTDKGKTTGSFKDRQGNLYTVVKLKDNRYWLGTNLKYKVDGSLCYNNDKRFCKELGRLYTQAAARKGCTELGASWQLPSVEDWKNLAKAYGGYYNGHSYGRGDGKQAYRELTKTSKYGFWARLGGQRTPTHRHFKHVRQTGYYWTSTPEGPNRKKGFFWSFWFLDGQLYHDDLFGNEEDAMYSVRCIITDGQTLCLQMRIKKALGSG